MEEKPKRKSATSSESKMKYNQKTYTRLILDVRKEEAEKYKEKCAEMGIPYSKPLRDTIKKIISDPEKSD